ncbi:hypothetical protein WICMUC_000813 [Wickerhamomyces mucosus]|uniref:DNA2/NAM7 helicase-like C-terminal domain-containing protein n=1 Tax=Wickerhamomyces mucosus TaxID=1378264 RepID=A0A9P8PWM1_9ASCO|nr:hypothetical protein WICMUC_000813 [Wickerhamomyces mucosus]
MGSHFNDSFLDLFNIYSDSKIKFSNKIISSVLELLSKASTTTDISILNNDKFISYLIENFSRKSTDLHVLLITNILQFKPVLNNDQLSELVNRLIQIYGRGDDGNKFLIVKNLRYLVEYDSEAINDLYSILIWRNLNEIDCLNNELEEEMKTLDRLTTKKKNYKLLVSSFLFKLANEYIENKITKELKKQILEIFTYLLSDFKTRKYVKKLLDNLSFRVHVEKPVPSIFEYFYDFPIDELTGSEIDLQDRLNQRILRLQAIVFKEFQVIVTLENLVPTLQQFKNEQIRLILARFGICQLDSKKLNLDLLLHYFADSQFQLPSPYSLSSSFDITYPTSLSTKDFLTRNYLNLRYSYIAQINDHLQRTVLRLEKKGNNITGSSKYVIKLNRFKISEKAQLLSPSSKRLECAFEIFGDINKDLKVNDILALNNLVKERNKPFKLAKISKFNKKEVIAIFLEDYDNIDDYKSFDIAIKFPPNLKSTQHKLELAKSFIGKSLPNWISKGYERSAYNSLSEFKFDGETYLNTSVNQLTKLFPNHEIDNDAALIKKRKIKGSNDNTVNLLKLTINDEKINIKSSHEPTQSLNEQQLKGLVSSIVQNVTLIESNPGTGQKVLISSIIGSFNRKPILLLSKNNKFNEQLIRYILDAKILSSSEILDLNQSNESKIKELENLIIELMNLFHRNSIESLKLWISQKWIEFLEVIETESEQSKIIEIYPFKSYKLPSLAAFDEKSVLVKQLSLHHKSISDIFIQYQTLNLLITQNKTQLKTRLIIASDIIDILDFKYSNIIVFQYSLFDNFDLYSSFFYNQIDRLILFGNEFGNLSNIIQLKDQFTKTSQVSKLLGHHDKFVIHNNSQVVIPGFLNPIEAATLNSKEIHNFNNFYQNVEECEFIYKMIQYFHSNGFSSTRIGVFTTSQTQVLLLKEILEGNNINDVFVGLINDNSGIEFDIAIVSTVRTSIDHDITVSLIEKSAFLAKIGFYLITHKNVLDSINKRFQFKTGLNLVLKDKQDRKPGDEIDSGNLKLVNSVSDYV